MALNIKDPETDRLARELASLTGQPITVAVRVAVEEQLSLLRRRTAVAGADDLSGVISRGRERRLLDRRPEAEVIGYDDDGLPA